MLYSEWLDPDLVGRIQNKSPPIIFSLASLGFGGNLSQLFFVNNPSILLRPDKYNSTARWRQTLAHSDSNKRMVLLKNAICRLTWILIISNIEQPIRVQRPQLPPTGQWQTQLFRNTMLSTGTDTIAIIGIRQTPTTDIFFDWLNGQAAHTQKIPTQGWRNRDVYISLFFKVFFKVFF